MMKSRSYNSMSEFFADLKNHHNNPKFDEYINRDRPSFTGLSLADALKYKFSYPIGVEKLRNMPEVKVEADVKVKYYDSFDGEDINIDRMLDGFDFLVNTRKVRKLPKAVDIYVNIGENANIEYSQMLNKTYAALRVIDQLETLGVRCAVWVCSPSKAITERGDDSYVEVCVKNHSDPVNLGVLCTAISPWFLRIWFFAWDVSQFPETKDSLGNAVAIPRQFIPKGAIVIEKGNCLSKYEANNFIENIKIEKQPA